jgi:hypothetical protein
MRARTVRRVGFLASSNPQDQAAQSGSLYYMLKALERHFEEIYLCSPITSLEKRAGRVADAASWRLLTRPIAYDHLVLVARKAWTHPRRETALPLVTCIAKVITALLQSGSNVCPGAARTVC